MSETFNKKCAEDWKQISIVLVKIGLPGLERWLRPKTIYFSCRGLGFASQHLRDSLLETHVPGDLTLSQASESTWSTYMHTCEQNIQYTPQGKINF